MDRVLYLFIPPIPTTYQLKLEEHEMNISYTDDVFQENDYENGRADNQNHECVNFNIY